MPIIPKNYKLSNPNMRSGFSMIELILYLALVTIFIGGAITFAWDIIYGRVKSHVQQEVSQNLRLANQRLAYEIRNASAINSVSATSISLANSDSARNPTIFDLSGGRLRISFGSSGPYPVTSNEVTVSDLVFTNLTNHIRFTLTVSSSGPRVEYQESQTATSSAELRSH